MTRNIASMSKGKGIRVPEVARVEHVEELPPSAFARDAAPVFDDDEKDG